MRLVVKEGNNCWNVFLRNDFGKKWTLLESYPTKDEALLWAADMLRDLSEQSPDTFLQHLQTKEQ